MKFFVLLALTPHSRFENILTAAFYFYLSASDLLFAFHLLNTSSLEAQNISILWIFCFILFLIFAIAVSLTMLLRKYLKNKYCRVIVIFMTAP